MDPLQAKRLLWESLRKNEEPPKEIIAWLLRKNEDLDERTKIELVCLCAKAILPFDRDVFWKLARLLYPSYWYVWLVSDAAKTVGLFGGNWRNFYNAGIQGIRELPMGMRSLGYTTMAMSISDISKAYSYGLAKNSVKTLPFAYSSVFGGSAIRSAEVFVKIGFEVEKNIMTLTNIVNAATLLTPSSKVYVLSTIASKIAHISDELLMRILARCFNMFKYLTPEATMEAEAIMAAKLVEIYGGDIEELIRLAKRIGNRARNAIKHAIIRILQDTEGKAFYELDLGSLEDGSILSDIRETIERKKRLREKLMEKLSGVLIREKSI